MAAESSAVTLAQGANERQQRRARQRYTARCHVHDICQVLLASLRRPRPGAVYNVVDDEPAPRCPEALSPPPPFPSGPARFWACICVQT